MPPNEDRAGIDDQARRLYLARWLTRRATAMVGGVAPIDASRDDLAALAARLPEGVADDVPLEGVHFEPPYPGRIVTEDVGGRLVLVCTVAVDASPLGRVFTVLIAGRDPEVSVAPPHTPAR